MREYIPDFIVKERDLRVIECYARWMSSKGLYGKQTFDSIDDGINEIQNRFRLSAWSSDEKEAQFNSMIESAKSDLLPLSELDWLKNNERACYWVWANIFFGAHDLCGSTYTPDQTWYWVKMLNTPDDLRLSQTPSSSKERFREIVKFLDRRSESLGWQRDLIAGFKGQWINIYALRKPFEWLQSNNERQCDWAWNYMKNLKGECSLGYHAEKFSPVSPIEKYHAIYAAYDSWNVQPDSKKLFCINFNKAWHQKKHRDTRQGKKSCNLVLREEVKDKLDKMADKRGVKLSQLIEILIEKEYSMNGNM